MTKAPDVGFEVMRIECNIPAAGCIVINESVRFYKHDPYRLASLPVKLNRLILQKGREITVDFEHNGYIPRGYVVGMSFLVTYTFIGQIIPHE